MVNSFKYLKDYKKQVIFGPMFKMLEAIFELLIPFIVAFIIDEGSKNQSTVFVIEWGSLIIFLGILGLLSTMVCQYFASIASQGYGTKLRDAVFQKIFKISKSDFDKLGRGYIQTLLSNDINQMQSMVAIFIRLVIRAPFLVLGSLVCSFIINWQIGFIFLVITLIIGIILFIYIKISSKKYLKIQQNLDEISTNVSDTLDGVRVIKGFNKQEFEQSKFEKKTKEYKSNVLKVESLTSLINPLTYAIINVGIILIIYFGNFKVNAGNLTTGNIVALINYLNQILTALLVVSNVVVIQTKGLASKKRIDAFLSLEDEINMDKFKDININKGSSIIDFNNVDFSYNNDSVLTLKNINFSIKKGMSVGLIGGTASGKTTVINLIDKFYKATNGEILYKGVNINEYDTNSLREEITVINQKTLLFKDSIKNNLKINKEILDDEILTSLENSNAIEFVKNKENSIDYMLEEDAKNLSGGQKQRLSIARGLLNAKEILIIDDAYSALDYKTEKEIKRNVKKLKQEKNLTTITISQRTSSIKDCDLILVMEHGEIIAQGSHEELLNTCEVYKEINDSQSRGIE